MTQRLFALASGLLLLAGCAMGPQNAPLNKGATLVLNPELVSGAYRTQASESAYYAKSDIDYVIVTLFTVKDGVESPVTVNDAPVNRTVLGAGLDAPVTFKNLHAQTTYRVKAEAYKVEPALIRLISTKDADSTTDIVVTNEDRPTVGTLKVRLAPKLFNGERNIHVDITPGGLKSEGEETMTEKTPLPG